MSKKSFKLIYDSPVAVSFVLLSLLLYVLDSFALKGKLGAFFSVPSPFNFSKPIMYFSLVFHVFANDTWQHFFVDSLMIMILGSVLEERYGSSFLGVMIFISCLVSGVLSVCAHAHGIQGASEVVFTLIILSAMSLLLKKQLSCTWILIFVFYIAYGVSGIASPNSSLSSSGFFQKSIPVFISFVGGVCGSLFGLLACPKKRASKTSSKEKTVDLEATIVKTPKKTHEKEIEVEDDDETVIGTISL